MRKSTLFLIVCSLLLTGFGCTLGPDFQKPAMELPAAFKSSGPWQEATPGDERSKGNWWATFGDPVLDSLENEATAANQQVHAAVARLQQARAAAGIAGADRLPQLGLAPSAQRGRSMILGQPFTGSTFSLPLDLGYEIDLFGRVRRSVEAAQAQAQASLSDYHNVLLSVQAEVARSYFALRALDAETALLSETVELRRQALALVTSLFENGRIGELDVARAKSELATTEAEAAALKKSRGELENGLAVLTGNTASDFSVAASPLNIEAPAIAAGLPSRLLERRPDVAAAERQMAAANARIGIAKTAFFPAISLTGSAGYASTQASDLLKWDSRTWGLGPAISLPIFQGGRLKSNLKGAEAAYLEVAAGYRQTVLTAVAEVEDALLGLSALKEQAGAQDRSVEASLRAAELSEKRYRSGLVSYLEVVDTQRTALQAQRAAAQVLGQQLQTSVLLVKALGGGWENRPSS